MKSFATLLAVLCLSTASAGTASADPLGLTVRPNGVPLFLRTVGHRPNPNVTPSNPMGVVGWDGPPDDSPSVIGDAEPLPPGSPAATPYGFFGANGW